MNDKIERNLEDKSTMEQKYERTKKALKEAETSFNRQVATIEREKAIIAEKLSNNEAKMQDLESKLKE